MLLAAQTTINAYGVDLPMMAACTVMVLATALIVIRAIKGPTAYDRILGMNAAGTCTVVIVALIGFATERPDFLDMALTYAILNFLGTIAILKFVKYKRLG